VLAGLHAFERAPPFPHEAAVDSIYELMCMPLTASVDELKHAFREFALRQHPDKLPGDSGAKCVPTPFVLLPASSRQSRASSPGTRQRERRSTALLATVPNMMVTAARLLCVCRALNLHLPLNLHHSRRSCRTAFYLRAGI
jgi:hypothetical protein